MKTVSFRVGLILLAVITASATTHAQQDQSLLYPVPEVEGALSWGALQDVAFVVDGDAVRVDFGDAVRALDGETVKAVGFILPLDPAGSRQLLTQMSPHCSFCLPVGPEGMIEIECAEPLGFIQRAVVVEGRFDLVENTTEGRIYRMSDVELLDE